MEPPSASHRTTGIPRLSKLPVLSKRSSQIFAAPPEPPAEAAKPVQNGISSTSRLQKGSSIASLPRTSQAALKDVVGTSKPPLPRAAAANGARPTSRPTARPLPAKRALSARPPSRANQQRPASASSKPAVNEDEENHDQLSSLDSFRSASRQGFHEDDSPFEPAVADEDLYRPRDRTKSRPSLSDRTIESLQQVPSTPNERRRSSFFAPVESPMGPPPRPTSAMSRNGNTSSRPGTSDGTFAKPSRPVSPAKKVSASAKPASRTTLGGFGFTPAKQRSVSTTLTQKLQASKDIVAPSPRSLVLSKQNTSALLPSGRAAARPLNGSKTFAARTSKPRAALGDVFAPVTADKESDLPKVPATSKRSASGTANASSAALREQIAAAKAAARKEKSKQDSPQQSTVARPEPIDDDMHIDPFNQAPKDGKHMLRNRIRSAWSDGKLNIAAMNLKQLPDEVLHMFDTAAMEEGKVNWAEVVDLTRLIAADNELELLDDIFPDKSVEEMEADEESQGNPFGGLEAVDLHGNNLQVLPIGLRRLERLTSLNLTHNNLENASLEVLSQIEALKDLRIGHNNFSGSLPQGICGLKNLEVLDLQANRILALPEALRELVSLRVLNVAGNQLTSVPMDALHDLPLNTLDASGNALIGSLFPLGGNSSHPTLQSLNVANNSLAALTFSERLDLPQLRMLDVTNNHLTILPDVSGWTELVTLMAGDNKISELPAGFTTLTKLRNVNFTSNDLRLLDPEIARMDSLESLILASNPLRDKKYLTMTAADIKHDLRARLEQDQQLDPSDLSDPETVIGPTPDAIPSSKKWSLSPTGTLDLSSRNTTDTVNDALGSFLQRHDNEVSILLLSQNNLTTIPPALWLGQDLRVLDLSNNNLGTDYLSADLDLPCLRELRLRACNLTTLEPLTAQLSAPLLQILDLTANRLSGPLPVLRTSYPALTTLLAMDNKFVSLTDEALRGFTTVDLSGNELERLPPEVGLLWDEGLRHLEVGRNAFRVPSYRVLERGTEAVMRALRNRLVEVGEGDE